MAEFYSVYISIRQNRILANLSLPTLAMPAKGEFYSFSCLFLLTHHPEPASLIYTRKACLIGFVWETEAPGEVLWPEKEKKKVCIHVLFQHTFR